MVAVQKCYQQKMHSVRTFYCVKCTHQIHFCIRPKCLATQLCCRIMALRAIVAKMHFGKHASFGRLCGILPRKMLATMVAKRHFCYNRRAAHNVCFARMRVKTKKICIDLTSKNAVFFVSLFGALPKCCAKRHFCKASFFFALQKPKFFERK